MAKTLPKVSLDAGGTAEDWPVIDSTECIRRMGQARFDELLTWAEAADAMSREVAVALSVVDEILSMVKTAGQLARMVPDMIPYLSPQAQQEISGQKRASQLPYEWAAYPRDKVDAAMITLAKCHLVRGLVDDSKHISFGGDNFSWAVSGTSSNDYNHLVPHPDIQPWRNARGPPARPYPLHRASVVSERPLGGWWIRGRDPRLLRAGTEVT
jgi:hypothetical protein